MIITIFIHGTVPPAWALKLPFINDFYHCPPGLTLAKNLRQKYRNGKILRVLSKADPKQFPMEHLYAFGWSGKLDEKAREQAARKLWQEMQKLIKKFVQPPTIRLITHSHGGNVALLLAKVLPKGKKINWKIDQLIALACPVQLKTQDLVKSPLFKHMISIHSHLDAIQVADPQGLHPLWEAKDGQQLLALLKSLPIPKTLFSQRHFPASKSLMQVHFTYHRFELLHIHFLTSRFFGLLPALLKKIRKEHHSSEKEMEINWDSF